MTEVWHGLGKSMLTTLRLAMLAIGGGRLIGGSLAQSESQQRVYLNIDVPNTFSSLQS